MWHIHRSNRSKRKVREREREDSKRALISFFPSTRGVSVKLIKFRENFYNTRLWKNVQVYTSWQFMLHQIATLCPKVGYGRAWGPPRAVVHLHGCMQTVYHTFERYNRR